MGDVLVNKINHFCLKKAPIIPVCAFRRHDKSSKNHLKNESAFYSSYRAIYPFQAPDFP